MSSPQVRIASKSTSSGYGDDEMGAEDTVFRKAFKHYKKKERLLSLVDILNPRQGDERLIKVPLSNEIQRDLEKSSALGLRPLHEWKCFTMKDHEGLFILADILQDSSHLEWVDRCLRKYPESPGLTNVHLHFPGACDVFKHYQEKLRWTTLGIHYDWTTKVYNSEGCALPLELSTFADLISRALSLGPMHADAAIINYFPRKGNLGPHVDRSERDLKNPLISLSLGQNAIYLTGGTDLDTPAFPFLLQSGDVLIMHGSQRLVYHAVPSIRIARTYESTNGISKDVLDYANEHRISLTLRQVEPSELYFMQAI